MRIGKHSLSKKINGKQNRQCLPNRIADAHSITKAQKKISPLDNSIPLDSDRREY